MRVELNTDMCPIVIPDTYGTEWWTLLIEDETERFHELLINKAEEYIKDALKATDLYKAEITMGEFHSPREYNFKTDWIDFTLEIPDDYEMAVDDEFFKYAEKNFGSHPGFMSFYPTTKEKWETSDRDDLKWSMYILWLFEKENNLHDYQHDYLESVEDYAFGNGIFEYESEEDICGN